MAQVISIHSPQAASGFRSHYMHALVICKQNPLLIFVGSLPSSQSGANRLSLVPLDNLQIHYPNRYIRNMEFWLIRDGVSGFGLQNALTLKS